MVDWHLPHKKGGYYKRPFARSTQATSGLIVILGEDGLTWEEAVEIILFDDEAKAIVQRFIDEGYGNRLVREFVK